MSVRLKRAAKALRARYGVSRGVQQARPGDTCKVQLEVDLNDASVVFQVATRGIPTCSKPAHVVGLCLEHMKAANKPRRR